MNDNMIKGLAFLGGAAVGAGVSYYVTRRVLEKKFEDELVAEMEKAKEHYEKRQAAVIINSDKPFDTPAEAAQALLDYQPTPDPRPRVEDVVKEIKESQRNVFEDQPEPDEYDQGNDSAWAIPDFVLEDEIAKRTPLLPYVITDEEFAEGFPRHEQFSLTYYEGDKVLVDSDDDPVDDIEGSVGRENLLRFGHGSNDSRIVYVRNEKRHADYEVVQHDGTFAEVIGFGEHNRTGRG